MSGSCVALLRPLGVLRAVDEGRLGSRCVIDAIDTLGQIGRDALLCLAKKKSKNSVAFTMHARWCEMAVFRSLGRREPLSTREEEKQGANTKKMKHITSLPIGRGPPN